ncbi:MAG: hypothetical protein KDC44_08250, partial [Phaeodactylibacter sp.]|nr:hypothetical protein [Phaeodactylibacter sp.]
MWTLIRQGLLNQSAQILHIEDEKGKKISFKTFLSGLQQPDFADFFNQAIAASPYPALSWECRPVQQENLLDTFECVVLESPGLLGIPKGDPSAFQSYFQADQLVVDFPNLGGDAHLIVPCPRGDLKVHGHLASFCRGGDPMQVIAFWASVGK